MLLGSPARSWLAGLAVTLAVFLLLVLLTRLASGRLRRVAEQTPSDALGRAADVVGQTTRPFLLLLAAYAGLQFLRLPEDWHPWIRVILLTGVFLQAGLWGNRLVDFVLAQTLRDRLETPADTHTVLRLLGGVARFALWSVVLLLILDNIPGVSVGSLVASLGIAGIAVGLALQSILGDLFASMSIALDRPFVIGDLIRVDDLTGTVEHIGLKSTRVRSQSGELLVFSNSDLLRSRVRNYKTLRERRVLHTLGVTYNTSGETLEQIPDWIRQAVEAESSARFERAHFTRYGDFALEFEYVYFILSPDHAQYLDIQHRVNLRLRRRFAESGVEFAFPTQTLHLVKEGPGGA